jgi:drug/metabolite transporter (DMT)-like permease
VRTRLAATALLIAAWGSTFTSVKVALEGCPPMLLAGARCLVGGLLVAVVALLLRRRPGVRGNVGRYAALTAFNVVGFLGLQALAIEHLPSGIASVLLFAAPLLGDRLTTPRLAGALVAFAGVAQTSVDWSGRVGFSLAWTTLVGTTLAWLLWMWLVSGGDVGRVAVSIFLVPVVAVLLGWWQLDEEIGWSLVAGTVLVCAGVLLVNAARTRAPQTPSDVPVG